MQSEAIIIVFSKSPLSSLWGGGPAALPRALTPFSTSPQPFPPPDEGRPRLHLAPPERALLPTGVHTSPPQPAPGAATGGHWAAEPVHSQRSPPAPGAAVTPPHPQVRQAPEEVPSGACQGCGAHPTLAEGGGVGLREDCQGGLDSQSIYKLIDHTA